MAVRTFGAPRTFGMSSGGGLQLPYLGVDETEFSYLDGLTAALQTQLNSRPKLAGLASANFLTYLDSAGEVGTSYIKLGTVPYRYAHYYGSPRSNWGTKGFFVGPNAHAVDSLACFHAQATSGNHYRAAYDDLVYWTWTALSNGRSSLAYAGSPRFDVSSGGILSLYGGQGSVSTFSYNVNNVLAWSHTTADAGAKGLTTFSFQGSERIRANSDGVAFNGVTTPSHPVLATGVGASTDDVITALQNLGLVKQS